MKPTRAIPIFALLLALLAAATSTGLPAGDPPRKAGPDKNAKAPPGSEIFNKPTVLDFQL